MATAKEQMIINSFVNMYVDRAYRPCEGHIIINKGDGPEHNRMIIDTCLWLMDNDIPFFCQLRLKNGCIPDITTPTYIKKFIEVFHTETMESFNSKKRPKYEQELQNEFIFVNTKTPFNPKMIQ